MSSLQLLAPLNGQLVAVENVPDPVFAEEMLGSGFAIDPTDGALRAPFAGTVKQIAPTGHSVTLLSPEGAEVLIHIGVDTVTLKGQGFAAHVQLDQVVSAGTSLITFDLPYLQQAAPSTLVVFVLLNSDDFEWQHTQDRPYAIASGQALPLYLAPKGAPRPQS